MPPWHWDKIHAALPLYPRVSMLLAQQFFEQYGGIARAVLLKGDLPAAFHPMQSALTEASPGEIIRQVSGASRKVCALV